MTRLSPRFIKNKQASFINFCATFRNYGIQFQALTVHYDSNKYYINSSKNNTTDDDDDDDNNNNNSSEQQSKSIHQKEPF